MSDTVKKNSLGLKVLSLLVVVMFVSVTVVCPVVKSDESSAAVVEEEPEMPEELLNEYIAEELENISNMAEEELMEEFGVTMEEYQESMEALAGSTLMLVGDEEGNISIEITESIDSGRAGPWMEGNYFYFGIESFAWSAIKWWFSSDCINMLVDQACKGEIDAVAIAEKELSDIGESLNDIYRSIVEFDRTLESIKQMIEDLNDKIIEALSELNGAYDAAIASYEEELAFYEERERTIDDKIETEAAALDALSGITVDDILNMSIDDILMLSDLLAGSYMIWEFLKGYEEDAPGKCGKFFSAALLLTCIINNDMDGLAHYAADAVEDGVVTFTANAASEGIDHIKETLRKEITDLENSKVAVKTSSEQTKQKIADAKEAKRVANETTERAKVDEKDASDQLTKAEDQHSKSVKALEDEEKKFNKIKSDFEQTEKLFNEGKVTSDKYEEEYKKYTNAKESLNDKRIDVKSKIADVHKAALDRSKALKTITESGKKSAEEAGKIADAKKISKANDVKKLKNGLDAAKISAKVGVKATAKASCKAAIAATGIGTVIMIAVDIVMALLIKFIEDHFNSEGYDTSGDYGIMVKVQVLDTYTIHKTFRILWRTCTIHYTITAPCIPRLDGVYMQ